MTQAINRRILVIDDTPSIHADFRKILSRDAAAAELGMAETAMFGRSVQPEAPTFELDCALDGEQGVGMVESALRDGRPYAVAFVDMRMSAGWDGVKTIEHLWRVDPQVQVAICTAYSDYPWEEVTARLDVRDRLLVIKKPFDVIEVSQLARTLTAKWEATRQAGSQIASLARALADLRESHKELETLAHSLAHDLRAPLMAMSSFSHLLGQELAGAASGKARHYLERIQANAGQSERLISALLQLDNVSRAPLQVERLDLSAIARQALDELLRADGARPVEQVVEEGMWVMADLTLTRIALGHLLSNALKFARATGTARIEVGSRPGPQGQTEFHVRDNGMGFDMAHADQLFLRPQRLHHESGLAGSGVGLVVVARVIGRHGGRVWAESAQDGGSTFRFTLPSAS